MFIKELFIYIDYLKNKIAETNQDVGDRQKKYLKTFTTNLKEGIAYYHAVFNALKECFVESKAKIIFDLDQSLKTIHQMEGEIEAL